MVSVYRLVTIWNSPQFPVEFRNGLCAKNQHSLLKNDKKKNNFVQRMTSWVLNSRFTEVNDTAHLPISFQELLSPWPAVRKRDLWEQPVQACAIACHRCRLILRGKPDNQNSIISFYLLFQKWMLPELSFSDRWSRGTKLWERDCTVTRAIYACFVVNALRLLSRSANESPAVPESISHRGRDPFG